MQTTTFWTIDDIKDANHAHGGHWFEPATLRFFRSRVGTTVYQGPGGIFFVSSEQFRDHNGVPYPRRYTVRQFTPESATVETVGTFNVLTRGVAHRRAAALAHGTE